MPMFGQSRRPGSPLTLDATRDPYGVYTTPGFNPNAPDLSRSNLPAPVGGGMFGRGRPAVPINDAPPMGDGWQGPDATSLQRTRQAERFTPADQRRIGMGDMPEDGRQGGGFGKFVRGAGKVLETVGAVAAFGPFAPMALRDMRQRSQWREEDRGWELEERERQRQEWQRPKLFNTGEAVVAIGDDMQPRTVFQDQPRQSEQERLFEAWSGETDPARKAMLGRMIRGFQYTPEWQQTRVETAGDTAEAQAEARSRYRAPPRAPAPRAPRLPTVNNAIAPIVEKWSRGEPLSQSEMQVLAWSKATSRNGGARPDAMYGANAGQPNTGGRSALPPPLEARTSPPRPNPAGNGNRRVRLPDGYTPARARSEAAATIRRNPASRPEVLRRLQAAGVQTNGL